MNFRYLGLVSLLITTFIFNSSAIGMEFFSDISLKKEISQLLKPTENAQIVLPGNTSLRTPVAVKSFYTNNPQPHWFHNNQPIKLVSAWLEVLQQADLYGLEPSDYPIVKFKNELLNFDTTNHISRLAKLEVMLTDSFFTFADHLRQGRLDPGTLRLRSQKTMHNSLFEKELTNLTKPSQLKHTISTLEPRHTTYRKLRSAFINLKIAQKNGGWSSISEGPILRMGNDDPRVAELRKRLSNTETNLVASNNNYFDNNLKKAVKTFQKENNLKVDGVVGPDTLTKLNISIDQRIRQVKNNLERWRWLPTELGEQFVSVNIPDFTLITVKNNQIIDTMKVSVGRKDRPTPILSRELQYLVFNPFWHVPNTIATKDFVPKLVSDPDYLEKLNIKVFQRQENISTEVDPNNISWQEYLDTNKPFPYLLRQEPGPSNALGHVKFMFPNEQQIYLHDTPMRNLMSHTIRTDSSGCVRLENATNLVNFVMQGEKNWSEEKTKELMNNKIPVENETIVRLSNPIPIYITYFNAQVNNSGKLMFGEDPYELDI